MMRTRILNTQLQYAAIVIQRYVRGHQKRKELWSWHGVLTRSRVLKIQRVFRGFLDRNYVRYLIRRQQQHHANKIIGLFYGWKARRLVAILKAEYVWNCVIRVQKVFRGVLGRAQYAAYRLHVHSTMARRIQRVGRGHIGRRRAKGVRRRMQEVLQVIRGVLQRDSDIAMSFKRITIETYSQTNADEWALFQLCMCNLLGTQRLEIAVDLAILLCIKAPNFGPAKFAYLCSLLSAWPDVGKAHIVREDWLEEAMYLLLQLRDKGKDFDLMGSLLEPRMKRQRSQLVESQGQITSEYVAMNAQPVPLTSIGITTSGFDVEGPKTLSSRQRSFSIDPDQSSDTAIGDTYFHDGIHSMEFSVSDEDSQFLYSSQHTPYKLAGRDNGIYFPLVANDDNYSVSIGIDSVAADTPSASLALETASASSSIASIQRADFTSPLDYTFIPNHNGPSRGPDAKQSVAEENRTDAVADRAVNLRSPSQGIQRLDDRQLLVTAATTAYDIPQPPWMVGMDPASHFFGGILEEIEYMFFHNCLLRYDKNLANLIQMSCCVFAVNAASLGDGSSGDLAVVRVPTRDGRKTPGGDPETDLQVRDMRGKGAGIGRARRLLDRAKRLIGQVDAESMGYRMQVLENIFESQHKEVFRQRRLLKDLSAQMFEARFICSYLQIAHGIDFNQFDKLEFDHRMNQNTVRSKRGKLEANKNNNAEDTILDAFKVSADFVCYRCGDAMMVTAQLVVVGAQNAKPIAVSRKETNDEARQQAQPIYRIHEACSDKWANNLVARPLILLPHEVETMHRQSIPFFCNALMQDENSVRMRGKWRNVAEYIMQSMRIVSCGVEQNFSTTSIFEPHLSNAMKTSKCKFSNAETNKLVDERERAILTNEDDPARSSFPTSRIRVCLPMVEYGRRERNSVRVESTAVVLLQRAYRGFRSRALKRRLKARLFEDMRQHNRNRNHVMVLAKIRRKRYFMASLIQAAVRGYVWRKKLHHMKQMAIAVQCAFRVYKAIEKVHAERRRRASGPPVMELIRRTVIISDTPLLLVGYRCGSNYKFIGYDFQNQMEYACFVYQPEAANFIEEHNSRIEGPRSGPRASKHLLTPWRHKQLMEALAENLSITTATPSATAEFGGTKYITTKCLVLLKNAKGKSIIDRSGQRRVLMDTKECIPQSILEAMISKSAKIHF